MLTHLTTKRLTVSSLTEQDAAFIHELLNTKGWLRFIGDRNVHSTEAAIAYINKVNSSPDVHYWVARLRETSIPIGIITLIKRDYLEYSDIGFAFLPQYSGKGYAFEAAKAVLSALSSKPQYATVLATTLPRNTNSIKLLTRLGLRFFREIEAEGEKLHVYSSSTAPLSGE